MPDVTFLPDGVTVFIEAGGLLLDAAKLAGFPAETPCGGKGVCGKCLVRVAEGYVESDGVFCGSMAAGSAEPGSVDTRSMDTGSTGIGSMDTVSTDTVSTDTVSTDTESTDTVSTDTVSTYTESMDTGRMVLLCRARAGSGPVVLEAAVVRGDEQGRFCDGSEQLRMVERALLPGGRDMCPYVKTAEITVPEPVPGDGKSDFDRLASAACKALDGEELRIPLPLLRELPKTLRSIGHKAVLAYYKESGTIHAVDLYNIPNSYALALDIGTTTVAVSLAGADGRIIGSKSGYNRQITCGLDIISRIHYARTRERRDELRDLVLRSINELTAELCAEHGADAGRIHFVSAAANTTMTHLLLGVDPEHIRLAPYVPAAYGLQVYTAGEIGLTACANAPVWFAPGVGSYVGGDIVSGLLCTSLSAGAEEICLFVDIGTNGEIVLGNSDFLMACACSAGPAFEGGGIRHGMRASHGAIERVRISGGNNRPELTVIGDCAPTGICGSGMISLVSELFSHGLIDPTGKFWEGREFVLADESAGGGQISVNEADVKNLIRAKAAVFSAIRTLLRSADISFEELSHVYIAGGFGRYLDLVDAARIGLLPRTDEARLSFIGNASLSGAYMALVSETHRRRQIELSERITYIDLSDEPSYMNEYTAALFLPHTDEGLFGC